jgi:hypothetical protein
VVRQPGCGNPQHSERNQKANHEPTHQYELSKHIKPEAFAL